MSESYETDRRQRNLRHLCVTYSPEKKQYYYPKTIPRERENLAASICVVISVILFMVDIVTTNENDKKAVLVLYTTWLLVTIALQFLHRLILMCEECMHLVSRYNGSYMTLFKDALYFNTRVWVTLILCFGYSVYYFSNFNTVIPNHYGFLRFLILLVPSIYLMDKFLKLSSCPLRDSLWVAENNGLDYGSGMAYSFFHGYLNLVLPKTGTEAKNLKELMQDYEDQNNVKFAAYKLFMLIPNSLNCFVSLKNESSPSIDESSSLPEKIITVAGVQNRVYKNAVYKIISDNKKLYVVAEYATPLKTFKDVFDTTGAHSVFYEKHKKDIILQFYLTLKRVLERSNLNEFCELIYYEDSYRGEDNITCYFDVGKIILTRLKALEKSWRKKYD